MSTSPPTSRVPPAGVFSLPVTAADAARLQRHCEALGLPSPVWWYHTDLHRTLRELIGHLAPTEPLPDAALHRMLFGLTQPVVVVCNVPPPLLQQLVRAYKAEGEWPVFAVITPQSLPMTLAVLLEHLAQDRGRENQARKAATRQPLASE